VSRRRLRSTWTVAYLAVVVTLVALIVPAWQRYSDGPAPADAAFSPPPVAHLRPLAATRRLVAAAPKPAPKPQSVRIVLVAARGDCWVRVRAGSPTGRVLFEGTVPAGARRAFTGPRLVVLAGAPQNLDVSLGGARRTLGAQTLWVATRKGLAPLRL
jgi:hypothetical protein